MGRAFVVGDGIDTDVIAPGRYLMLDPPEMAMHCLESVRPDFAKTVQPGDILVAGENFGIGSSRELAAGALKELGIAVVLAKSYARIFYRNALNIGLPVLQLPRGVEIAEGDDVEVDIAAGKIYNKTQATQAQTRGLPPHLRAMVEDGGLIPHLKKKLLENQQEQHAQTP